MIDLDIGVFLSTKGDLVGDDDTVGFLCVTLRRL